VPSLLTSACTASIALSAACATHSASTARTFPDGPAIVVDSVEALVIFPSESPDDFPVLVRDTTNRFGGPGWFLGLALPTGREIGVALHFPPEGPRRPDRIASLRDAARKGTVNWCLHSSHYRTCGAPIVATAIVDDDRLVIRVTDRSWLGELWHGRPQWAAMDVQRSDGEEFWAGRVAIEYSRPLAGGTSRP
jgi:hypothetical protein